MQGSSDRTVELMDAAAFASHLIPADSVCASWLSIVTGCSPTTMTSQISYANDLTDPLAVDTSV
jgi:hypothetical protein